MGGLGNHAKFDPAGQIGGNFGGAKVAQNVDFLEIVDTNEPQK